MQKQKCVERLRLCDCCDVAVIDRWNIDLVSQSCQVSLNRRGVDAIGALIAIL